MKIKYMAVMMIIMMGCTVWGSTSPYDYWTDNNNGGYFLNDIEESLCQSVACLTLVPSPVDEEGEDTSKSPCHCSDAPFEEDVIQIRYPSPVRFLESVKEYTAKNDQMDLKSNFLQPQFPRITDFFICVISFFENPLKRRYSESREQGVQSYKKSAVGVVYNRESDEADEDDYLS